MKLTIIFNIIIVASVDCFSYDENKSDGPSKWGSINKNCNGFRQSPINLKQSEAYNGDLDANPLRIEKINEKPIEVKAWNSGRSFSIQMKYADGRPARIIGGPLPCAYNINAIYFHWGENDNNGSEHAINGKRFSLEAQIEAYNPKYKNADDAYSHSDGIVQFGNFYKLTYKQSSNPFVSLLQYVVQPKIAYVETKKVFSIKDLIKKDQFEYFSYLGSLPVPGCYEVVQWIVSTHTIPIKSTEIEELRKLLSNEGSPIIKNNRPLQPTNNRDVFLWAKY